MNYGGKRPGYVKVVDHGKWLGASSAGTNLSHFSFPIWQCGRAIDDSNHRPQFDAVVKRLRELANTLDGNGYRAVDLAYLNEIGPAEVVVAFRFTSDWAYNKYSNELTSLGSGLARGVWNPFSADAYDPGRRILEDNHTRAVELASFAEPQE